MKLFMWRDIPDLTIDDANGLIVIADDLTHAYGLMTQEDWLNRTSVVFNTKPYLTVDIPEKKSEVIPFIGF